MNVVRRTGVYLSFAVFILVAGRSDAKEFVWKFEKGQSFQFEMNQSISQTIPSPQGEIAVKMVMGIEGRWKVTDKDDEGNVTVEQSFKRMTMNMDVPGQKIVVDSADENTLNTQAGRMFGNMIKQIQGLTVIRKLSPRGKVIETSTRSAAEGGGIPLPGFSPDNMKEMAKESLLAFPNKEIEKGDSWTDTVDLKLPQIGLVKVATKYTYVGTEQVGGKELDRFDGVVKMSVAEQGEDGDPPAAEGEGTVTAYFDSNVGRIVRTEGKQEMKVKQNLFGQVITAKITIESKSTLKPAQTVSESGAK